MDRSITIGSIVTLKRPYGKHTTGPVVNIFGMTSASGIRRTKYSIQFPHSRTKSKTVNVAYELEDFV